MKKWRLLPAMAVKGIRANGMVYYPYMAAGIFSVFTYFVFASIHHNELIEILPHSPYVRVLLALGKALLVFILFCFLLYAGSFVNKRRKKEIGLYNLLGLEKKHIGAMLFAETLILYLIMVTGGIILGMFLAKLFFLLMLKLSNLPVDVEFVFTVEAFIETLAFFGAIFIVNYVNQIWELGKSRPTELLSGGRKGEKEPRLLPLWSLIGLLILGMGYRKSVGSQVNDMLLIDFFLAVLLVVVGTYFVFTSGSVLFLKCFRKNKRLYYRPSNFITVSGMYYRMKKNAAGLVNICIFSTMTLITLICTVSLSIGLGGIVKYMYPYDVTVSFREGSVEEQRLTEQAEALMEEHGLEVQRKDCFEEISLACDKEENRFHKLKEEYVYPTERKNVIFWTLEDYRKITGKQDTLSPEEVFVYSNGVDFGYDTLEFMGHKGIVKEEKSELYPYPKAEQNIHGVDHIVIVPDKAARDEYVRAWAEQNGVEDMDDFLRSGNRKFALCLSGNEDEKFAFADELINWCKEQPGFLAGRNGVEGRDDLYSMYGGLLFLGMIFALLFVLCLVIVMYYKQISEGYEDQTGFSIMKKVGMSDEEIKSTIHRQIFMVFGLPLAGALLHTLVGMFMVEKLMAIIDFFDIRLMMECVAGMFVAFSVLYGITYVVTARTYYRIVNHRLS